jgi:GDP-L-fucose synthase
MNKWYLCMIEKSAKIYVAGHTGMVGSAIVRKLNEEGFANIIGRTIEELDLTNQHAVNAFFTVEKPDYVILAAAKVGGILANNTYRAQFIYENLMIQNNIIHNSWLHKVKKLLFLGSSCIYPKNCPQPIKEEYLLTGELEQTNEPYALAKIAGIKLCESYFRQYGCDFISVMPTNLYGPNDNYNLETSHVLPALIRKIHLAHCLETGDWQSLRTDLSKRPIEGVGGNASDADILAVLKKYGIGYRMQDPGSRMQDAGVEVVLWGTGKVYREFLHVDDMAAGCLLLMEKFSLRPAHGSGLTTHDYFLNLGSGIDQTIEERSVSVKHIIGFRGEIRFDHIHADGTPKKLLDCSRIQSLGFKPKYTLEQGIRRVYDEYLAEP